MGIQASECGAEQELLETHLNQLLRDNFRKVWDAVGPVRDRLVSQSKDVRPDTVVE